MTSRRLIGFWIVLGVLLASAVGISWAISASRVYLRKIAVEPPRDLAAIATDSAHWERVGDDRLEPAEVLEALGTENYVSRTVVRKRLSDDDPSIVIDFHAAYYTGMIDTVPHVPDRCFIGGGMQKGGDAQVLPIELDPAQASMRREDEDPFIAGRTPEWARPVTLADGTRTVYWIRLSNKYSRDKGKYVRVPFDPSSLKMRVTEFIGPDNEPLYAGYFFLANGGITPDANGVRLLAFKPQDKYAYYLKVQFTSGSVGSAQELATVVGELLSEQLGEILACTPDWIELEINEASVASGTPADES